MVDGATWARLRSSQIKSSLPPMLRATTAWEGTRARWHLSYSSTDPRVLSLQSSSYSSLSALSARFSVEGSPHKLTAGREGGVVPASPWIPDCLGIC